MRITVLLIVIAGLLSLFGLHLCLRHRRKGEPILLHVDRWPGKNGPLKPGFVFRPEDYPELAGFDLRRDERWIHEVPFPSVERSLRFTRGAEAVEIEIEVALTSTDDAHQALFREATNTSLGGVERLYRSGKSIGLNVGDLSLVPIGMREDDLSSLTALAFVRSNIRIHVRRTGPVLNLAQRIDLAIRAESDVSPDGLLARRPTVARFGPTAASVPVLSSVPIQLVAHDSGGRSLEYEFESSIGKVERSNGATTFFTNHESGTASLKVTCFSPSLLFQTATAEVVVRP